MLNGVMTLKEAGEIWGKSSDYLKVMLNNPDKYPKMKLLIKEFDYSKSGGTWLITKEAMEKLYGKIE